MQIKAFYGGSFDPPTNGHVDIVGQALALAAHITIAIGAHPAKKPLLARSVREGLIGAALDAQFEGELRKRMSVTSFSGLAVEAARAIGATVLIRGLRDGADLDEELRMASMNRKLAPEIVTVFLPCSPENRAISATLVRQIHAMGGDISAFVPAAVAGQLLSQT